MNGLKFFVIRKSKESSGFWKQSECSWQHIMNCDKFSSKQEALDLIDIQAYMKKFFEESVIESFYIVKTIPITRRKNEK